jgi:hypothetical protein
MQRLKPTRQCNCPDVTNRSSLLCHRVSSAEKRVSNNFIELVLQLIIYVQNKLKHFVMVMLFILSLILLVKLEHTKQDPFSGDSM